MTKEQIFAKIEELNSQIVKEQQEENPDYNYLESLTKEIDDLLDKVEEIIEKEVAELEKNRQ